ncbi:hypothetical protein ACPUVO_00820 [Pseudocolwellia sp. HL-MZ19]|uniref:hypothetical protein n=1 Tax=unclassified Pseudocolwellia TaxID=2848178 RepID=UPI003CECA5BA
MKDAEMRKLSQLFEKMVANKASADEQQQLTWLYQVFIDEGREGVSNVEPFNSRKNIM